MQRQLDGGGTIDVADHRHGDDERTNVPPAKIAAEGKVPKVEKARHCYSLHLPPTLRFDPDGNADRLSLVRNVR